MTRTTPIALASLALLIASTATAGAHERYREDHASNAIQLERARQRAAIEAGRKDGSITWLEKYELNREQARLAELERDALADGRLSKDEYFGIRRGQHDAARHIDAERHDAQVRGWWWRLWR